MLHCIWENYLVPLGSSFGTYWRALEFLYILLARIFNRVTTITTTILLLTILRLFEPIVQVAHLSQDVTYSECYVHHLRSGDLLSEHVLDDLALAYTHFVHLAEAFVVYAQVFVGHKTTINAQVGRCNELRCALMRYLLQLRYVNRTLKPTWVTLRRNQDEPPS